MKAIAARSVTLVTVGLTHDGVHLPLWLAQKRAFFQPDLQYVFRPGGTGRIPDALVLDAQVAVNF